VSGHPAERADTVIIGAGIIGLSTGFHLLQADPAHRVVIVELAGRAGSGSTAKATGGFRHQFAHPALIRLSQRSISEYRAFASLTGVDVDFEDVGYLLFSTTPAGATRLRAAIAAQRACGVDVVELAETEAAARWPYLRAEGLLVAGHTPGDGHADPYAATMGYLQAIRRMGGRVILGEAATGLLREGSRVTGVTTAHRTIAAGSIVNAAGVSAAEVAAMAGLSLPVRPYRRQIAVVAPTDLGQHPVPFTMHTDSGWYLHRLADGTILVGGIDHDTHPGTEEVPDPELTMRMMERGVQFIPKLADAALVRSFAGLRALTPDQLPVLGPVPDRPGFFCACGLAGHGFMHAPAVGQALAEWILSGRPAIDELAACRPDRFADLTALPSPDQGERTTA
jgi:sarcosine oxidase subunit beta